ncbi:MAG: hypothetical protein LIR46_00615 [Bacteroidota bacterium]|nr:hypothetical protein [Bacteroidota bacterium]
MLNENCYWYREYQDMQARVPTCEFYGSYGHCPCAVDCEHFISKKDVSDMVREAETRNKPRGTYQCFHCGSYSVVWGADFTFEDYGYEGEGIVHSCHCANCGADVEYRAPLEDNDD